MYCYFQALLWINDAFSDDTAYYDSPPPLSLPVPSWTIRDSASKSWAMAASDHSRLFRRPEETSPDLSCSWSLTCSRRCCWAGRRPCGATRRHTHAWSNCLLYSSCLSWHPARLKSGASGSLALRAAGRYVKKFSGLGFSGCRFLKTVKFIKKCRS
jgi:hypothetical protein